MFTEIPSEDPRKSRQANPLNGGHTHGIESGGNSADQEREDAGKTVSRRQIARLIGSARNAFYVLDEQDVVVYVNEAMVELGGEFGEQLIGIDCGFSTRAGANQSVVTGQLNGTEDVHYWKAALAPPAVWDRNSVFVESWSNDCSRMLVPLDPNSQESKAAGSKLVAGRGPVLVIITKDPVTKIADQLSFSMRKGTKDFSELTASIPTRQIQNSNVGDSSDIGQGDAAWIASGGSLKATALRAQIQLAVQSQAATLIVGPRCQVREELADWIHQSRLSPQISDSSKAENSNSKSGRARLFRIDCHLLDEKLLDDLFEVIDSEISTADAGVTLHLARLDEFPSELVLLLDRFLAGQNKLRVIATTSTELKSLASTDSVWERIRLRVEHIQVTVPAIGARLEDLESLVSNWLKCDVAMDMKQLGQSKHVGAPGFAISNEALDALCAYAWPGSYYEFAQVLHDARKRSIGRTIEIGDLPISIRTSLSFHESSPTVQPIDLDALLENVEKQLIEEAIQVSKGNRSSAAKLLNISRARIIRRMQQWGMMPEPVERQIRQTDDEIDLPKFEEID